MGWSRPSKPALLFICGITSMDSVDTGLLLEGVDQTGCAGIVAVNFARGLELGLDLLGKRLAELDTPLVEGVDVPDGTLGEGQVLVVGDQSTQSGRGDLLGQNGGGGTVAQEGLVGDKLVGGALCADILRGLANHESLGLGEVVGGEHLLVLVVLDRVVRLGSQDEVGGDELSALVEELVERVLCVGGGLSEEDGTGGVLDVVAATGDGLSVRLHGELLEVSREAVQVLVEGRNKVSLSTEEVGVPDAQKTTEDGDVLLEGSLLEVLVHGVSTSKEVVEVVVTNVQADGKTDGAPDGVTATDPVGKAEHVLLVNTELGDLGLVGRESNEVLCDCGVVLCVSEEPLLGSVGVGAGLSSGEGLGSDEEESSLGVRVAEGLGHVGTVNVGDEVELHVALAVRLESLGDHDGAATQESEL
jgi:hypothetical protein